MADNLPAPTKILRKVHAMCAAAITDRTWHIERSDEDPLTAEELPGVCIRLLDMSIDDAIERGAGLSWVGTLMFDCQSGGATGLTIDLVNQETIASIIETLFDGGDATLEGMVDEIEPRGADSSEQSVPDVGWAVLQYQVRWFTSYGDMRTIIGRDGHEF